MRVRGFIQGWGRVKSRICLTKLRYVRSLSTLPGQTTNCFILAGSSGDGDEVVGTIPPSLASGCHSIAIGAVPYSLFWRYGVKISMILTETMSPLVFRNKGLTNPIKLSK